MATRACNTKKSSSHSLFCDVTTLTLFTSGPAEAGRADALAADGLAVGVVVALTVPPAVLPPGARGTALVAQYAHVAGWTCALARHVVARGARATVADALALDAVEAFRACLYVNRCT